MSDDLKPEATIPNKHNMPSTWPPPPRQRPKRSKVAIVSAWLAIILSMLLIFSSIGLIIFTTTRSYNEDVQAYSNARAQETQAVINTTQARVQGTANAINTAQANIEASATAQADQTAIATVNVVEASATATTYQELYSQWTNGTSVVTDTLSSNQGTGKWDQGSNAPGTGCRFKNGAYLVSEGQRNYLQPCIAQATQFSNFAYQINVSILKDLQARAGLLFRVNSASTTYYFFHIGANGTYALDLYNGQKSRTLAQGFSVSIKTGLDTSNQISVIANNENIYLFANDEYIAKLQDTSLKGGKIGVGVINMSTPAEAEFSYAQVWKQKSTTQTTPTVTVSPTATATTTARPRP